MFSRGRTVWTPPVPAAETQLVLRVGNVCTLRKRTDGSTSHAPVDCVPDHQLGSGMGGGGGWLSACPRRRSRSTPISAM